MNLEHTNKTLYDLVPTYFSITNLTLRLAFPTLPFSHLLQLSSSITSVRKRSCSSVLNGHSTVYYSLPIVYLGNYLIKYQSSPVPLGSFISSI